MNNHGSFIKLQWCFDVFAPWLFQDMTLLGSTSRYERPSSGRHDTLTADHQFL